MIVLSIIIPSYNSSEFIDKNIKTFIDKRLFNRVEILIINDGSKDNTAEKAEYYSKKYPDLIHLVNKENGNHGSVINTGVRISKGKYFKVVDADDWVDTLNLIKLVDELSNIDVDLIVNPYFKIDEKTGKKQLISCGVSSNANSIFDFESVIGENFGLALHSVTYKTSIFIEHNIYLTEKCFYEDFQFAHFPIPYITNIRILDFPVYYYLVGQKSQSVDAENSLKNIAMYLKVYEDTILFYEQIKDGISVKKNEYIRKSICRFLKSLYHIYLRNAKTKNIYKKMIDTDFKVKMISEDFYYEIGKSKYIRLLRKNNILIFYLLSGVFSFYKYWKNKFA